MAEDPHRSASEFLACVGHELRTPLNAMLGMLELSLGEPLSADVRDYLVTAHDAARTLTATVQDIQDLALAESGDLIFEVNPIEFGKVLTPALRPLQQRAREAQRELELRISPLVPSDVCADAKRLQQIVVNLTAHALKRLDRSRLVVEIQVHSLDDDAVGLELGVSEFGIESPDERRQYVPLEQLEIPKYSAPGLGLTVANCWLRLLDGHLWTNFDGEANNRFYATFRLPRDVRPKSRDSTDEPNITSDSGKVDYGPRAQRALKVLVADDTLANQKVVMAVLRRRGHQVELADNGCQAVERVRQRAFDVVLMDAQMPTMNGLEAAEAIRHLPNAMRAKVPIIAMTAHTMQEDRERCLAAGMDDYLPKPLDMAALVARVEYHGASRRAVNLPDRQVESPSVVAPGAFLSGALARLGGDTSLLLELIRLFRQDAKSLCERIHAGLSTGDAEAVSRAAHNLRGLAASFDATSTVEIASRIEQCAARGDLVAAQDSVPALETELTKLLSTLHDYQTSMRE